MSGVATTDPPNRATRIARWIGFGVPGLLVIVCIAGLGWFLFPVLFPQIWANHLSRSQGKVELLASAGEKLDFASLSPDGRWMVMQPLPNNREQQSSFVLDLTNEKTWPFDVVVKDIRWLGVSHFVVYAVSGNLYDVIDVDTHSITPINIIAKMNYQKAGGFSVIKSILEDAKRVYILESFGEDAGYKIIIQNGDTWTIFYLGYGHELGMTREELEALLTQSPHIDVPRYARISDLVTGRHTFSPDGQFYVTTEVADNADVNPRAAIYTRDDQLVAYAYKAGWTPYVWGWAHDSSGVYLNFAAAGLTTMTLVPYRPLFKLSPYTAEEQWWRLMWAILAWVAGIAAVGAAGWWRVVRKRRMVRRYGDAAWVKML